MTSQARNQLGKPGGAWDTRRRVFWEGPKIFELFPIVINHVQHFSRGVEKFSRGSSPLCAPWLGACDFVPLAGKISSKNKDFAAAR